jgi:alpha-beta hydrolase superfamily lysophospholipase
LYERLVDRPNAEQEARQMSKIENYTLGHEGKPFNLTTFRPTDRLRTWLNQQNEEVQYPELLMVHGVASDERYFWSLFEKMNKLGIPCSAIELPRERGLVLDGAELINWQIGALLVAREFLIKLHNNDHIVLGGQSRGSVISILGAEKIAEVEGQEAIDGLLLLAPSIEPKSKTKLLKNLAGLGYNSFRYSRNLRLLGREALMVMEVVLPNPIQTIIETHQAITTDVTEILYDTLGKVPVYMPAADHDEFVDHKALFRHVQNAPLGNIAMTTLTTNHMLGERNRSDIISHADPRLLSGQILAWLQSLISDYRPLSVSSDNKTVTRLADTNN